MEVFMLLSPVVIILSPVVIIFIIVLIKSSYDSYMSYIWNRAIVDNKFAMGDEVIIKKGIYRGRKGIIKDKAFDYKMYIVVIDGSYYRKEMHEELMDNFKE